MAVVGEMQDEVGYHAAAVVAFQSLAYPVFQGFLRVELLSLLQFHVFQQLLQFQFAKVALHFHLARQGTRQPVGGLSDSFAFLHVDLDGLVEAGECLGLLLLGFVESLLHVLQTPLQRVDDLRHLLLVLGAQFFLPQLQDLLRCSLHLLANQVELVLHLLFVHLLECSNLRIVRFFRLSHLLIEG